MIRTALLVFSVFYSGILWAGTFDKFSFTVLPASPVAGEPFSIKVNVVAGSCHQLSPLLPITNLGADIIRVEVVISDICTVNPAQERVYQIPPLAAGEYTFRYAFCGVTVLGYSCTTIGEDTVVVSPGSVPARPHAVPTSSWAGMAATVLFVLLAAFARLIGQERKSS